MTIKRFVIQYLIALMTFMSLGFVLTLHKKIKKNRRYKKTCKQIGWTPRFERPTLLKNR